MKKIVFLTLSPQMWDGLETLWDMAISDKENEVVVIPLPTYKRDSDDNLSDASYSLSGYPKNVPITDVNGYSLRKNHPDIIYTQNVQDANNKGFCVHPAFHTDSLRACTDQLVYVPYMCTEQISLDNEPYLDSIKQLFISPSMYKNIDRILVQSQNQKDLYLHYLAGANPELIEYWSQRISYNDYPRNEILKKYNRLTVNRTKEWDEFLQPYTSNGKKVLLLCTSVMGILTFEHPAINRLKNFFTEHLQNMDDFALIWRPYPAIEEAVKKLRPNLVDDYNDLISYYRDNHIGILDELPSPTAAIILSDEYMGDACGTMELFRTTGKPIVQLDYNAE